MMNKLKKWKADFISKCQQLQMEVKELEGYRDNETLLKSAQYLKNENNKLQKENKEFQNRLTKSNKTINHWIKENVKREDRIKELKAEVLALEDSLSGRDE